MDNPNPNPIIPSTPSSRSTIFARAPPPTPTSRAPTRAPSPVDALRTRWAPRPTILSPAFVINSYYISLLSHIPVSHPLPVPQDSSASGQASIEPINEDTHDSSDNAMDVDPELEDVGSSLSTLGPPDPPSPGEEGHVGAGGEEPNGQQDAASTVRGELPAEEGVALVSSAPTPASAPATAYSARTPTAVPDATIPTSVSEATIPTSVSEATTPSGVATSVDTSSHTQPVIPESNAPQPINTYTSVPVEPATKSPSMEHNVTEPTFEHVLTPTPSPPESPPSSPPPMPKFKRRGFFLAPQRKEPPQGDTAVESLSPVPSQNGQASTIEDGSQEDDSPMPYSQWRIGKTPGHQGMRAASKRRAETLSDDEGDITSRSARVLKRPFRPPTRIAPPATPSSRRLPNTSSTLSTPIGIPTSTPPSGRSTTTTDTNPPSSPTTSTSTGSLRSKRVGKPFRPPCPRSDAPSPSSSTNSIGRLSLLRDADAGLIKSLEARVRTLRQAVRYANEPDEDERVARLVVTWRDAGREVADRLFALLPAPDPEELDRNTRSSGMQWGWDDPANDEILTPEQKEFLRTAKTNAHGDVVDDDGNVILPDADIDLDKFLESAAKGSSAHEVPAMDELCNVPERHQPVQPTTWDRGAMLLRLGVDPELLGWDGDGDDWTAIDD